MKNWLDQLIDTIDWKGNYNHELQRIEQEICDALCVPPDELSVGQDSDGERLYWKLWNLARDERARIRKIRISHIAESKYGHLDLTRANALAALDYAKEIEASREHEIYQPNNKTAFAASSKAKAKRAYDKNMSTYKNCNKGINNMLNLDYSHLKQIQVWYGEEEDPEKR